MNGNFKIYCYGAEQQPAFIYRKQHKEIEADTENIEFDHGGNAALVEYGNHKKMNEQKTDTYSCNH